MAWFCSTYKDNFISEIAGFLAVDSLKFLHEINLWEMYRFLINHTFELIFFATRKRCSEVDGGYLRVGFEGKSWISTWAAWTSVKSFLEAL